MRLAGLVDVDDRELRVREEMRSRVDRLRFGEADADYEVVAAARERGQVRDVFGVGRGQAHVELDAELRLRLLHALVGEVVEAAVVQAADVRDEAHLERLPRGGVCRGRRGVLSASAPTAGSEHASD